MTALRKMPDGRAAETRLGTHEGVWEGTYRYYDADGNKVDEHRSRLVCRFPAKGRWPYYQSNHYSWADGRTETREFPATIENGKLVWGGGLIEGWAASVPLDAFGRTTMLYWTRCNEPNLHLYEMIQISDCGSYRSRVWQWFRDDRLVGRTLIDEIKVADDWSAYPVSVTP